ncbi:MAG: hypothetical protein VB860_00780 [Dehalococcoidia bacterium]
MNRAVRAGMFLVIPVLFVLATACGSDDTPPDAEFAPRIEVLAPIDQAEVVVTGDAEPDYLLRIVSGLPNGCAKYDNTHVRTIGDVITVSVMNTIPEDVRVACTEIYGSHERTVELQGLENATDYEIIVNSAVNLTFSTEAEPTEGTRSVQAEIIDFRLELMNTAPLTYDFIMSSGLESSCITRGEVVQSRSGGRLFGDLIRINLTNLEDIDSTVECTGQFTPYEMRVTLPGSFAVDAEYEILLNFGNVYKFIGGSTELRIQPPTS